MDAALREQQQAAEEIDARALPIIGWGLVLTTFWPWLALVPTVSVVAYCVGMGLGSWALYLIAVKHRPSWADTRQGHDPDRLRSITE